VRLVLLGPPGAGKGTQAARLCRAHGLLHLSTGDLLRAAVKAGTPTGREAKGFMDRGELVPDAVVFDLLREQLRSPAAGSGFLLDGFPRNVAQAEALDRELRERGVERVVHLRLEDEEIVRRLLGRGRPDDTEQVIRHRLEVYRAETAPLIEHYEKQRLLVTIDARGTVDEVAARLTAALAPATPSPAGGRKATR
jgi:adenylate kinase